MGKEDVKPSEEGQFKNIELPEPPKELRVKGFGNKIKLAFKLFGPGAIIASVTLGSGETIWAPRAAALFGFSIFWAYFWGVWFKLGTVYPMMRYRAITGENSFNILKFRRSTAWIIWFFVIMLEICVFSWAAGFFGMGGTLMRSMTGVGSIRAWGILMMTVALILALTGGYRFLEKAQTAIVFGIVILMWVAAILAHPPWLEVLKGIIPQPVHYPDWAYIKYPELTRKSIWVEVGMYLGSLGGGLYDYLALNRYVQERKWGMFAHKKGDELAKWMESTPPAKKLPLDTSKENVERARIWGRPPWYDQVISFVFAIAIGTLPFLILSATLLHPNQLVPSGWKLVDYQVQFLRIISPYAVPLYWLGMFFAIFGTEWGMFDTHASTFYELLRLVVPKVEEIGYNKFKYFQMPLEYIVGLIIFLTGVKPEVVVSLGGTLGGVFGMGIYGFLLYYIEKKRLPKEFRLSTGKTIWLLISSAVLLVLGSYSLYQWVVGL